MLLAYFKLNNKLTTCGKYISMFPEVEIVEYSNSKKYSSNFWARVLAATLFTDKQRSPQR